MYAAEDEFEGDSNDSNNIFESDGSYFKILSLAGASNLKEIEEFYRNIDNPNKVFKDGELGENL